MDCLNQYYGENFALYNGDTTELIKNFPDGWWDPVAPGLGDPRRVFVVVVVPRGMRELSFLIRD